MASDSRRAWLTTTAALTAAAGLLFAPAIFGDGQFLYRDAGRMHHPVKHWVAEELRRGHWPEWNPYAGLGVPIVAGAVDAPLHPFNVLLVALPFEAAFKAWILLSVLAAGLGAAAWARRLGQGTAGATIAGLAFMLSGFVVSSTDNLTYLTALAGGPWLLAAGHAAAVAPGPGALLAVMAASFVTAAAGDPMGWAVAVGLVLVQTSLVSPGGPGRRSARAAALVAVAALAAAPVLLPVAAWLPHSSRAAALDAGEYLRWNLHPLRLAEFLVPHLFRAPPGALYAPVYRWYAGNEFSSIPWVLSLYLGASTLALAALGGARSRTARTLLVGAAVVAWMSMGPYAGFGQLARHLPVLSNFRFWEKLAVWITLLVAVAAGAGADRLLVARAEGRRLAMAAGVAGSLLLAGWAALMAFPGMAARLVQLPDGRRLATVLVENTTEGAAAAALGLLMLAAVAWLVARGTLQRMAPATVGLVVALDLGAAGLRAYFLIPPALVSAPAPIPARLQAEAGLARVVTPLEAGDQRWPELTQVETIWRWTAHTGGEAWNVAGRFGNLQAYTGMLPRRLDALRRQVPIRQQVEPSAIWGFEFVTVSGSLDLAAGVGLAPPYHVEAEDRELPAFLLRRPARPRAFLAGALTSADEAGALAFVASPGASASGRSVVEAPVPPGYQPPTGEARVLADDGERIEVTTHADGPALLVLNDQFAPGWTADVDGRPAEILAANFLARGVWVEAGRHQVVFRYRTPFLREGLLAAGALLAGLAAWAIRRGRGLATDHHPHAGSDQGCNE